MPRHRTGLAAGHLLMWCFGVIGASVTPALAASCPKDAGDRHLATPTGILWGTPTGTTCASLSVAEAGPTIASATVVALREAHDPDESLLVSVGLLPADPREPALPLTYAALPRDWADAPERIVLRLTDASRRPSDAPRFRLVIGRRMSDGQRCQWWRATHFSPHDAYWLKPDGDRAPRGDAPVSACDAPPADAAFAADPGPAPPRWPRP